MLIPFMVILIFKVSLQKQIEHDRTLIHHSFSRVLPFNIFFGGVFFLRYLDTCAVLQELQALLAEEQRSNEELRAEMMRCSEQNTAQVFAKDEPEETPSGWALRNGVRGWGVRVPGYGVFFCWTTYICSSSMNNMTDMDVMPESVKHHGGIWSCYGCNDGYLTINIYLYYLY